MGCQVYFYSGAYNQELKQELNCDQLFSVYHEKKLIQKVITHKKEHPEYTAKIMVDSGAFSHYQNAKKKGIILTDKDIYDYTDDYLAFLNEWGWGVDCFVGVDSVPNPDDVDQSFADKTWANYLYMWERLKPELRHKLIPVFHYGEDWKYLERFLEHVHPDGSKIDYIGLAISLEGTKKVRISWGQEAMSIIAKSSNPNVKTHAFGVGVKSVLDHINVYSTDATSWLKRAAYGMISIDDQTIYVSYAQRDKNDGTHYSQKSAAYARAVEDAVFGRGFTFDPDVCNIEEVDDNNIRFTDSKGNMHQISKVTEGIVMMDGRKYDRLTDKLAEEKSIANELGRMTEDEGADVAIPDITVVTAGGKWYDGYWKSNMYTFEIDSAKNPGKVIYDNGLCISTNCYARARFNILDTERWMEKQRVTKAQILPNKVELW